MYSCFYEKQEIPWLFDAERRKKIDEGENVFFKALAKNFLLKSKKNLCRPSIKWTS